MLGVKIRLVIRQAICVEDTYWTQGSVKINTTQIVVIHQTVSYYCPDIQEKYIKAKQVVQETTVMNLHKI